MATGTGKGEAVTDPELWREQQRFFNFLQHYDLHKYHQRFLRMGVRRIRHFKDVTDADLDAVGLSPPEKTRLRKKLEENFSTTGKLKKAIAGKGKQFDVEVNTDNAPPLNPAPQGASLIAKEDIKLDKKIGEGAHGTVFEGTWSNVHGSVVVAVKTLYGKEEVQSTFIKEADSMRALLHEHIIQLYGIVLSSPLMLIQELAPCGDLHTYLEKHGATKNVGLFHIYATQITDAMKYLEGKRIVHRDLAARNILLASEDCIKLSDFGMARILDEQTGIYNLSDLMSRIPIAWTSLEALTQAKFSTASDVWSFAVTLWEIYSLGEIPWKGLTPIEIRNCLVGGERLGCPERCPREMYHVMTSCWESKPQDRPTFASIHQRLQRSPPMKVTAINVHTVAADEDNNCLSFQKGDLIFVIDRPKQGWLYGMLVNGKVGYLLEDHVTEFVNAKQWDKNGHSTKQRSHSPLHPKSPTPFRIVTSPSQSPVTKHKPSQIGFADTRYAPSQCSTSHSGSEAGSPGPMTPTHRTVPSTDSAAQKSDVHMRSPSDQYVTMQRGATMVFPEEDDDPDYLDMNPNLLTGPLYENLRKGNALDVSEEGFYSVPRSRELLPSDSSSSDGDLSRPGSRSRNGRFELPPRGDPELQTRTLPPRVMSQYSAVSKELLTDSPAGALSPTRVRYLPNAAHPLGPNPRNRSSTGDIRPDIDALQALNLSSNRPQPKPRKIDPSVGRSASSASPQLHSKSLRKSSSLTGNGAITSEAVREITSHNPQNGAHGLVETPPVPHRKHVPSTIEEDHTPKASPRNHFNHPLAAEFPDAEPELCRRALESHGYDIPKAREEIQVQILLGMNVPNTNAEDCRRALKHCQNKIDRAACWLVERGIDLDERRT